MVLQKQQCKRLHVLIECVYLIKVLCFTQLAAKLLLYAMVIRVINSWDGFPHPKCFIEGLQFNIHDIAQGDQNRTIYMKTIINWIEETNLK